MGRAGRGVVLMRRRIDLPKQRLNALDCMGSQSMHSERGGNPKDMGLGSTNGSQPIAQIKTRIRGWATARGPHTSRQLGPVGPLCRRGVREGHEELPRNGHGLVGGDRPERGHGLHHFGWCIRGGGDTQLLGRAALE